jgi:phosphopentomutase
MKRLFLIVLDSVGIGALPDAEKFGDAGADTMRRISKNENFSVPNLLRLGLGNIEGLSYLGAAEAPLAAYGRCEEKSKGKDTTVGHWEIAGLVSQNPLPTYPEGFPEEVISAFTEATGRAVICNKPYSGTDVIRDYGQEHLATGALIVYTSGDSVFQIAAHESIVPTETLYEYCRAARKILSGKHGVGRVIARPFAGEAGDFYRTADRRDFSLEPHGETLLDALSSAGLDVISVGKISDIFAGRGITEAMHSHGNEECMEAALELAERDFCGLCFINLVDFDMVYGHRNDVDGYAKAISRFDSMLSEITAKLKDDDVLIITADHGCDPSFPGTDHTRECIPLFVYGNGIKPINLGTLKSFSDIAASICDMLGVSYECQGESFADNIM